MKKLLIIMLMFLFLTVTGCSQEKDKSEIGDSTPVSDNEIGESNESISDIGINLVKKGQTLEIDDKEYILNLVESSVNKNYTTLNLAISEDNIYEYKKKGVVLVVEYKNGRNLYVGDSTTTSLVNSIYFLINEEEQLIVIHLEQNTVVMEIPDAIVDEILEKYKNT